MADDWEQLALDIDADEDASYSQPWKVSPQPDWVTFAQARAIVRRLDRGLADDMARLCAYGKGPEGVRFRGAPRYRREDVTVWARKRLGRAT